MFPCHRKWFIVRLLVYILPAILADGKMLVSKEIKLEASVTPQQHDVRIGSAIRFSCTLDYPTCAGAWMKDEDMLSELDKRITMTEEKIKSKADVKRCPTAYLHIRNITASDTGKYSCKMFSIEEESIKPDSWKYVFIYAVVCFQGYYCPQKANTIKRCPRGTFSRYKNATSVDRCQVCPTYNKNEIQKKMDSDTVARFHTNCPDSAGQTSNGAARMLIAIGIVTGVLFIVIVLAVLCRVRHARIKKYEDKLFCPPKDIEVEPPEMPRSKDVFVCYSSKNRQWVHDTLLANLKEQGFQIFIDFLDFEVGLDIQENIVNGIYGSRKTVFVLSRHSLKSFYARKELHQALAAGKTGHQVIVIMYEKCKVPAEITHMVYLDWTDENNRDQFWGKLYRAILRPLVNETNNVQK